MQDFIRDENIKLYRKALFESRDAEQRKILLALLRVLLIEELAEIQKPDQTLSITPAVCTCTRQTSRRLAMMPVAVF